MSKKDKSQNRDLYIKMSMDQAEMDLIKRKFRKSGMQTFSGSIRTMILEGYIVKIDELKFQEIHKLTTRFHGTGKFYIEWCEPNLAVQNFSATRYSENQTLKINCKK